MKSKTGIIILFVGLMFIPSLVLAGWVQQNSGTDKPFYSVHFPVDALTGYAVGDSGTILKTTDGGVWVEEEKTEARGKKSEARIKIKPNPFVSFAFVAGHEKENFAVYDIAGKRVGVHRGDRIGIGLNAGVYFIKSENCDTKLMRIVKLK